MDAQQMNGFSPDPYHNSNNSRNNNPRDDRYAGQPQKINGFAVASLVLGILSILLCCTVCFSISMGALSILFAILSKRRGTPMSGMSIAGIILSCVAILLSIAMTVSLFMDPDFRDAFEEGFMEGYEKGLELYDNDDRSILDSDFYFDNGLDL